MLSYVLYMHYNIGYNKEMLNIVNKKSENLNLKPLVATGLHKEYGERVILNNESLSINTGDKIGLVGLNGSGKTTLIKILAGLDLPDNGKVSNKEVQIGYLAQDYTMDSNKTVYEVATEGVSNLIEALDKFNTMSTNYEADNPNFTTKYDTLLNLLQTNNAFDLSETVQTVLNHLKVGQNLDTKIGTLSGGQIVRLALARIIISKPSILLLDEPTNHLDLHANLWLRGFLKEWQGGLLIVSHDRDFLNEITTSTWELTDGSVQQFGGNYEFYKKQKGFEEAAQEREVVRLSGEVKKAKRLMEKEKQRAAHSDRKDLSKKPDDFDKVRAHYFKERASKTSGKNKKLSENRHSERIEQLEDIKKKIPSKITPNLKESDSYKGRVLISTQNISCAYDDKLVIKNGNMNINFGDRIAIFGNNGSGKSTWIKGMLGIGNVITTGKIKTAENINVQLLDQKYAIVNRNLSVFENLQSITSNISPIDIRQHLAKFLFRENAEVYKKASILSGGEIARLALAMMAIQPVDLLVLDEPTNNLDIGSIEQIELVLHGFSGSILVVSHDITFLRNIGVDKSYAVTNNELIMMTSIPSEGEDFKNELLSVI